MTATEIVILLALGLAAGALGGLLGIGGSIIMIPVLTRLYHEQHLSQAVAMIVNLFVSLPAAVQHQRAKAIRWDVMAKMLPLGVVFILLGVEASNHFDGKVLERLFGVFLLYMAATNALQLIRNKPEPRVDAQHAGWPAVGAVGAAAGFMAGLLGIGGGNIAVPLLQKICRLPLRQCIATTAAFMCISASIGAVRKNLTLGHLADPQGNLLNMTWHDSVKIAAILAPTAVIGGLVGGRLTHALPLQWVRAAFILLLIWASLSMLGVL